MSGKVAGRVDADEAVLLSQPLLQPSRERGALEVEPAGESRQVADAGHGQPNVDPFVAEAFGGADGFDGVRLAGSQTT